jgi:hypothetical protein
LARNLLSFSSEVRMLAEDTLLSSYYVEVSGWDEDESFFVEKSQITGDDFTGKLISLRHNLPDGALIFLRLLNPNTSPSTIPIAFETCFVGCDLHGFNQFSLLPCQPRQNACRYLIN